MKLQLGVLHLNGRSASQLDCDQLLGEFGQQDFETSGDVVNGPIALVYRGDRITIEEDSETQPYCQGPYALTWDGRLDNREDIANRVGLRYLWSAPDPVIVLKAFEVYGEQVFADLIGEFALTLWCDTNRSLLFARSSCGARPLYYVQHKDRLLWSSNFAHLVGISGVDLNVDDEYVIPYLVTTPDVKHTPLATVHSIPPNRIVSFKNGKMQSGRELWNPIPNSVIRYRRDEEYEEHCRQAITEAVQVRLRAKGPIFAELSGGLDSSTVVLTADQLLRNQNESPHRLHTVSCVYEESKSADERTFIEAVEHKRGIKTHLIHEADQQITLGLEDPQFTGLPHSLTCFPGRYECISTWMRYFDARVLLTGRGGDHLFWSAPDGAPLVADQLHVMNLLGAHRQCRTWSRVAASPYYEFLTRKALPLALGSIFPRKSVYERPELPGWISAQYRRLVASVEADFTGYSSWRAAPSRRTQVFVVDRMFRMFGAGFGEQYPQIYLSHPYSHRPLIEFCLSVPLNQLLRNGQTRSLMRRALRNLLPSKTVNRVSKGMVDECVMRALRRERIGLLDVWNWEVCRRGYALPGPLTESLRQAGLGTLDLSGALIRLFSLERWLRSLRRVPACAPATAPEADAFSGTTMPMPARPGVATGLWNELS